MEYNLNSMCKAFLCFFAICLLTSCSNVFIRKGNFIDKLPAQIPLDSTLVLVPAYSMRWHVTNGSWNIPIRQVGRPDTFTRMLQAVFKSHGLISAFDKNLSGKCMNDKVIYGKWDVYKENTMEAHKCLPLQKDLYNVFFNVAMSIGESSGDNNPREFSNIICYVLVLKNNEALYYRCYFARRVARKKHFPKGHPDREDYPYFANDQIELVVREITKELISRIKVK